MTYETNSNIKVDQRDIMEVKVVHEYAKFHYGEEYFSTVWIKDNDGEWCFAYGEEFNGDTFDTQLISKALNSWSLEYYNSLEVEEEWYDCELCGEYKQSYVMMKFDNKKLGKITEDYSDHFGDGTSEEELIEQFKKVGIILTIEDLYE